MCKKHFAIKLIGVVCVVLLSSCSLFKFSLNTGDIPFAPSEVKLRTMTRSYYIDFSRKLILRADSMIAAVDNPETKIRIIQWKISTSKAMVAAVMQSYPEISAIDTWLVLARMEAVLNSTPDALLFDGQSDRARDFIKEMRSTYQHIAEEIIPTKRYNHVSDFVALQLEKHPPQGFNIHGLNTSFEWEQYLKQFDEEASFPIGTITEVTTDLTDRMGGQVQYMTNNLYWSKDIIEIQLEQDSVRDRLLVKFDTLEANFKRVVVVMEYFPEISDYLMQQLTVHVNTIIGSLNNTIDHTFAMLDFQREALQQYVTWQSDSLVVQMQHAANAAVDHVFDKIPDLIGEVLFYVVLFFLIMLCVPFFLGFWLGRLRGRYQSRKDRQKPGAGGGASG